MYKILYTPRAKKSIPKLKASNLAEKTQALIGIIKNNPFQNPPPYEKLLGNMKDLYSRRINLQHRLVYEINEERKEIKIISMWSHYENI